MKWDLLAVFVEDDEATEQEGKYLFEHQDPHIDETELEEYIDDVYASGNSSEIPDIEYDAFYNEQTEVLECYVEENAESMFVILVLEDGRNLLYMGMEDDENEDDDGIEEEEFEEDGLE